jgi:hypothetical protein
VKTGLFNVEWRVCKNGRTYLMEVSPRAGGNRLAEILNFAADVNIISAEVRKAVGLPVREIHEPNYRGHYAIQVLYSEKFGLFDNIEIDEKFRTEHVLEEEIRIQKNQFVSEFTGANASFGTLFLRFDTREELNKALSGRNEWLRINLR